MSCGSSGAKIVPCNLAGATSHDGPARGHPGDERIGEIGSVAGRGAERHAVANRGLRCPTSRLSSLGCEEMESASS